MFENLAYNYIKNVDVLAVGTIFGTMILGEECIVIKNNKTMYTTIYTKQKLNVKHDWETINTLSCFFLV